MMIIFEHHKEFYEERENVRIKDIVYGVKVLGEKFSQETKPLLL